MNNSGEIFFKSVTVLFWIAVALIVLLFLSLSVYSYPSGDDYTFANRVVQNGFWQSQKIWYESWTGRFTYTLAMSLISRTFVFENGLYGFIPLVSFFSIGSALYIFSRRVIPDLPGRFYRAGWIIVFMALYLTHLPSPTTLYWSASILKYQLATVLFLLLASVVIGETGHFNEKWKIGTLLVTAILAPLVIGCSETVLFLVMYCLAVATVIAWILGYPNRRQWLVLLSVAVAASLVVFFAPGNSFRFAKAQHSRDIGMILPSLKTAVGIILSWSSSPGLLLLSILFIIQFWGRGLISAEDKPSPRLLSIPFFWIVGIVLSFLPSAWGGSNPPFPRTLNLIYFIFLGGWFWSLTIIIPVLSKLKNNRGIIPRVITAVAQLLLVVILVLRGNTINAAVDLISLGPGFKFALAEREQLIRNSIIQGEKVLALPRILALPRSIGFYDITPDPKNWKNRAFSNYHHLIRSLIFDPEISRPGDLEIFSRYIITGKAVNLLRDPGFESGGGEWGAENKWLDREVVHSGRSAIHLTAEMVPGGNFWRLKQGPIFLDAGQDYVFGAFIKTRNMKSEVGIAIKKLHSRERYPSFFTPRIGKDCDWTLLIGVFRPRPAVGEEVTEIEFRAGRATDFQEGEFWVDDAFLLPVARFPGD